MEILFPLIGVICLSLTPALAYLLQSDHSGYVSVRHSRSFETPAEGLRKISYATINNAEKFSNARLKERKSRKYYSSPSFIPRERIDHRRIEVVPPTHFKKNVQNEPTEKNLIDKNEVLSNQRRGAHYSDVLQAKPRDRIDHRRIEVVAPTIYKKNTQNQSNENHYYSIDNSETLSDQRTRLHNSDGLQTMPNAKQPKDFIKQFIESRQNILQTKMYEKPSYLAVNVHKAKVTTAPLSLNVRWKYPTKMLSDQMQAALVQHADMPIQGEKDAADSNRKPDGRAQTHDKDLPFREYTKREAGMDRGCKDPPNHGFSDSLKRFISFKDKGIVEPRVQGAVGIRTENIEQENIPVENPYAIFYKMHQSPDDGFIPARGGSVDDESKFIISKNKQLAENYETKNPNRVMKKFFSFKNNKHY